MVGGENWGYSVASQNAEIKDYIPFLEGQGDLISRLVIHTITLVI